MQKEYIARYLEGVPQQVKTHLTEVSELAKRFSIPLGLPHIAELAGLLHDIGKYSSTFQEYIRSAQLDTPFNKSPAKKGPDHATAGAQLTWNTLIKDEKSPPLYAQLTALIIASHHGGLRDCLTVDGVDSFTGRMKKDVEQTFLHEVIGKIDPVIKTTLKDIFKKEPLERETAAFTEKLICNNPSPDILRFYLGLTTRFLFSALVDADGLSSAGRFQEQTMQTNHLWDTLIDRLERHLHEFSSESSLDRLRGFISNECLNSASKPQGMYQLTVPTGGGKTLSSLRFALHHAREHQLKRIFYIVPYTTIIDQNASAIRSILEDQSLYNQVILEHHSNLDPELDTPENRRIAENWDSPVIFTTMVQFLETLFGGRVREPRRMHNLAESVIIFDEVQTVPVNTVHLFNNAVNFLVRFCGSTIVFCTATQPLLDTVDSKKGAAELSPEPQLVHEVENRFKDLHRVQSSYIRKKGGWADSEIVERILNEGEKNGDVLTIVNTKKSALTLFQHIKAEDCFAFHLSTGMCPAHRMNKINEMKELLPDTNRKRPVLCISTQLIEAGVDIDFGTVIRFLSGLDSITQAAGRCNRNNQRPSGTVLIINPASENLDNLSEIHRAKEEAERVLNEYSNNPSDFDFDILGNKAMRQFYRYYFYSQRHKMSYPLSKSEIGYDSDMLSLLSINGIAVQAYSRMHDHQAPGLWLNQSFRKAGDLFRVIDAPTEGIIVPYEKGKRLITELCSTDDPIYIRDLLRQSQRYSINLYPWQIETLSDKGLIYETTPGSRIYHLDSRCYDGNDTGFDIGVTGKMEFLST